MAEAPLHVECVLSHPLPAPLLSLVKTDFPGFYSNSETCKVCLVSIWKWDKRIHIHSLITFPSALLKTGWSLSALDTGPSFVESHPEVIVYWLTYQTVFAVTPAGSDCWQQGSCLPCEWWLWSTPGDHRLCKYDLLLCSFYISVKLELLQPKMTFIYSLWCLLWRRQ